MDRDQIQAAKDRAQAVVDGFKRVTDQSARDVLRLADELDVKDKEIEMLNRKLAAFTFMGAGKKGESEDYQQKFNDLFGGNLFGKR